MADITTPGCTLVIFGASGDLTQRKLIPALHSLDCEGLLPQELEVLGTGRTEFSNAEFRERLQEGVAEHGRLEPKVWSTFADRLSYMPGSYDDPEAFRRLGERLDQLDAEAGTHGNRLFYLAIPPGLYPIVTEQLGKSGLNQGGSGWARLVIEKPFGHDLKSAQELNDEIHAYFDEDQIYRIDHYLGKETVQNIMTFRFANAIFEPLWNRKYIDHVQITVAENVGVEHRTGYYDKAGVLRDMFQNHLMQLLALIAMEAPIAFQADALRDEKSKVLQAISPVVSSVRGQYRGYRDEPDVAEDSHTATYAALRLFVENWRWHDVPFYLRSGKQLQTKSSEIIIQFKHVPHLLFPTEDGQEITPNILYLCIQPDEGFHLSFQTKQPGAGMRTQPVEMQFHYASDFGANSLPEAYERLLLDAIQGDASLFARADEIELAWKLIDPILDNWDAPDAPPLLSYEPGSWGPDKADDLPARDDRSWLHSCGGHGDEE